MTLRHDHPFSLRIELIAATPQGALRAEIELPEGALAGQVQHHLPADPQWHLAWKLSAGLSRDGECLQADHPLRDGAFLGRCLPTQSLPVNNALMPDERQRRRPGCRIDGPGNANGTMGPGPLPNSMAW